MPYIDFKRLIHLSKNKYLSSHKTAMFEQILFIPFRRIALFF